MPVLADCTGHGVPGALLTMPVASVLDRVMQDRETIDPAALLATLDSHVRKLLQDNADATSDDGLDAAIAVHDPASGQLLFAGARVPLVYRGPDGLVVVPGDRCSLGYKRGRRSPSFQCRSLTPAPGTPVYLATDGVADQRAPDARLFGRSRLLSVLDAHCEAGLADQLQAVRAAVAGWRGPEPVLDDMTLLAVRLG